MTGIKLLCLIASGALIFVVGVLLATPLLGGHLPWQVWIPMGMVMISSAVCLTAMWAAWALAAADEIVNYPCAQVAEFAGFGVVGSLFLFLIGLWWWAKPW